MATSTLIVYEPLEAFGENHSYWEEYSKFYEEYWGGPTSPFGVWFGNEYKAFRKSLSDHLGLDDSDIRDCFFLKREDNQYLIAPLGNNDNIYSVENFIPPEWFFLFNTEERRNFYTHWGFNTINYDANISDSLSRLNYSIKIIDKFKEEEVSVPYEVYIDMIYEGLLNIKSWLQGFTSKGVVVLNYGDICSHIHLHTLKNEDSVRDMKNFSEYLNDRKFDQLDSLIKIFNQKWEDIRNKCEGNLDSQLVQ